MLASTIERVVVKVPESGGISTASILVAVGAVLAAVITVIAAHLRHKSSLAAERQRLKDQLRAQEEHQERELSSQRQHLERQFENEHVNRDLDELRSRIDAAIDAGEEMLSTILRSKASLVIGEPEEARLEREQYLKQFLILSGLVRRVMLRLGRGDQFVQLLRGYRDGLIEMGELVGTALEAEDDEFPFDEWDQAIERAGARHRRLIDAATARFGSRIEANANP